MAKYYKKTDEIEEAILYCLATPNRGMRTEQIADMINRRRLHTRKDGQPVTSNQVYAVICRYPEPTNEREQNQACLYFAERGGGRRSQMFVKAEGRIMLMI